MCEGSSCCVAARALNRVWPADDCKAPRGLPVCASSQCSGPLRAGAIDMMHLCAWAIDVIDAAAAKTTLGHLMAKPGDVLYFCYDLGDRWRHTIKVVESVPPAESKGKVVVLDGAMQCPPEDSNGVGLGCCACGEWRSVYVAA